MEQKIKYQYTYFIYPFIISSKYDKYLLQLLYDKKCKVEFFEKEKDANMYTYFLPNVRKFLFKSFDYKKEDVRKFNQLDYEKKLKILLKQDAVFFKYDIEDTQAKIEKESGIFFNVSNIEIICFKNKVAFLLIKTHLSEGSTISDLCNFVYKFRDVSLSINNMKNFDNIKLQSENFSKVTKITDIIKKLSGRSDNIKELNIENERLYSYTYLCLDKEDWNKDLTKEFYKLTHVKEASYVVDLKESKKDYNIEDAKFTKFGISKTNTIVLTANSKTENYTKLAKRVEEEYLYHYIYEFYKKICLKKIAYNFKKEINFDNTIKDYLYYTKEHLTEEVTNAKIGSMLENKWEEAFNIKTSLEKANLLYDIMRKTKKENINKNIGNIIYILTFIMIVLSIINILMGL